MKIFKGSWTKEDIVLITDGLTENEVSVMIGVRNNHFSDIIDSGWDWAFGVGDASGLSEKVYRGVFASLVKKGLIKIDKDGSNSTLGLTDAGRKLYSDHEDFK
jgi:hypothetical protein